MEAPALSTEQKLRGRGHRLKRKAHSKPHKAPYKRVNKSCRPLVISRPSSTHRMAVQAEL
jgi:hypothetical protein